MSCKSILVVEDDQDIAKQVVKILEFEGYTVHHCSNGRLALDFLIDSKTEDLPGCIILDLMMPEMDGITFLKEIKSGYDQKFKDIKVLIATAKGSPVNPEAIPQTEARLQKPFELDELLDAVAANCGIPEV
jgi:CheY-like chemotaxis protein